MAIQATGDRDSRSFGNQIPHKTHLTRAGGLSGEIRDLRDDVDAGFRRKEARTDFPDRSVRLISSE